MVIHKTNQDRLFEIISKHYPSWQFVSLTKQGYIVQRMENMVKLIAEIEELYDETV